MIKTDARTEREAEVIGKRVQRNLVGKRSLTASDLYLHHDPLYVAYPGGWVELPGIPKKGATPNPRSRHDYDPCGEYDPEKRPVALVKRTIKRFLKEHEDIVNELGIGPVTVFLAGDAFLGEADHLAKYVNGTSSAPVIVTNSRMLERAATDHGVDIDTTIETTLLHEYGHAYVDSVGVEMDGDDEERLVEHFAEHVWRTGDYLFAAEIIRQLVERLYGD